MYVIFYGTVLYLDRAYTGIEKVSATFGSAVTGVLGFYFGQRPVQDSYKSYFIVFKVKMFIMI